MMMLRSSYSYRAFKRILLAGINSPRHSSLALAHSIVPSTVPRQRTKRKFTQSIPISEQQKSVWGVQYVTASDAIQLRNMPYRSLSNMISECTNPPSKASISGCQALVWGVEYVNEK